MGFRLYPTKADGTLEDPRSTAFDDPANAVAADFNNDDHIRNNQVLRVLLNHGAMAFTLHANYVTSNAPEGAIVLDFNCDGIKDVAIAEGNPSISTAGLSKRVIQVMLGTGDGSLHGARQLAAGSAPSSLVTGDFTGDGRSDLVVAGSTGTNRLRLLRGLGGGEFQEPAPGAPSLNGVNGATIYLRPISMRTGNSTSPRAPITRC